MQKQPQPRDQYFIALDLELEQPCQTIIEVGVVRGKFNQPEDQWERKSWLISPPDQLSEFIVGLTGISQDEMNKNGTTLASCAIELGAWINEKKENQMVNPVVWGGGDSFELKAAFEQAGLKFPHFGHRWLDVKTLIVGLNLSRGTSMPGGLRSEMGRWKLQFEGRPHRATDDAFNTLRLLFAVMKYQQKLLQIEWMAKND